MLNLWLQLIAMLIIILISSQLFTNALEYLGFKLNLSSGVTGSIFAAVATALPETMVPILAIVAGSPDKMINQQISVGAILGSSLMLSTLSTLLMGLSVLKKRGIHGRVRPEKIGFKRDLDFFLLAFIIAATAMFVPEQPIHYRAVLSALLVSIYCVYLITTCRASKGLVSLGHAVTPNEPLLFTKFKLSNNLRTIVLQLLLGLFLLLIGAKGFIDGIERLSVHLHFSALLLSLIIIPIATELPEKVNSIIWVRKNQDTLGFGNITGAMVFQGTLLPALGILLTPWLPSKEVITGIFITLIAAAWLKMNAKRKGIRLLALMVNGFLYVLYLFLMFK